MMVAVKVCWSVENLEENWIVWTAAMMAVMSVALMVVLWVGDWVQSLVAWWVDMKVSEKVAWWVDNLVW